MKKFYMMVLFIIGFLFSNMKIGYINADKILAELDDVRQVQIELEKEQRKIEAEYQNLQLELDSLYQSYDRQKMLMSEERRIKYENTIKSKEANLQKFQVEKVGPQGEIYQIHDRLMQPIYTKVDNVIQKVGKEKGYDYIFNVVSGGIVYALPQNDLTQDIIDALQKLDDIENE